MQTRKLARLLAGRADVAREIGHGMAADLEIFGELATREANERSQAYRNRNSVTEAEAIRRVASRALEARDQAAVATDTTIVATRHDIRSTAMRATAAATQDRGLRALAAMLQKRWSDSPAGVVTRAELSKLAAHFDRHYPKSKAASLLKRAGAVSLARVDKPRLDKLAAALATIQDPQERTAQFELALRENGLAGTALEAIRSRFYLEGRIAQVMDAEQEELPLDTDSDLDLDVGAPPHAESEETYSEVVSPASGETLVVELAPAEGHEDSAELETLADFGSVAAFVRSAAFDTDQAVRELGPYLETAGQLYPTKQGILRNLLMKVKAGSYSAPQATKMWKMLVDEGAKMYVREFALGAVQNVFTAAVRDKLSRQLEEQYVGPLERGEYDYLVHQAQLDLEPGAPEAHEDDTLAEDALNEQETIIEDPTSPGEMLRVTVESAETDEAIEPAESFAVFEGDDDSTPPSMLIEAASMRDAISIIADKYKDKLVDATIRAFPSSFERCAEVGPLTVVRSDLLSLARAAAASNEVEPVAESTVPVAESKSTRTMSAAQAQAICDSIGYTEKVLTASIMRGAEAQFGAWSMHINDAGDIAIQKSGSKRAKTFAPSKRAFAVRAMAVRIAEEAQLRKAAELDVSPVYRIACTACKAVSEYPLEKAAAVQCGKCQKGVSVHAVKTAMDAHEHKPVCDYLVAIRFPSFGSKDAQARALNSDRARALIDEITKSAEVISDADGEMAVLVRGASLASINRIRTVLSDRLGVVAQVAPANPALPANPAQRAQMPNTRAPGQPGQPGQPQQPSQGVMQPTPQMTPGQTPQAPKPMTGSDAQAQAMEAVKDMGKAASFSVRVRAPKIAQAVVEPSLEVPELPAIESAETGLDGMDADTFGPAEELGALDVATSVIDDEGEDLVKSALTHYRNTGSGVATAIKDFLTQYKEFLDDFGDSTSMERQMAEAAILRIAKEVYEKPAVLREAAKKTAVDPKPSNAGSVMGADSSQAEPKVLDPKIVGTSGTNIDVESSSFGADEGDLPKPKQKPGHDIGPAVSVGEPNSLFKDTMKLSASRGWGVEL